MLERARSRAVDDPKTPTARRALRRAPSSWIFLHRSRGSVVALAGLAGLAASIADLGLPLAADDAATADDQAPQRASEATAREPETSALQLASSHAVFGRVNPLGLFYSGQVSLRLRLFESKSPILRDNFIGLGLAPSASLVFASVGALVELQPVSLFRLWASYEVIGFFGALGLFQSFRGVTADHADAVLEDRADDPDLGSYATAGTVLNLGTQLDAEVYPMAIRGHARLVRPSYDLREGDRTAYDLVLDTLVPNEGWVFVGDLDVLWLTELGLSVGARWTLIHAFYEARHYAAGELSDENPNTPLTRLGPSLSFTFGEDPAWGALDRPTVFLLVQWWVAHRYRAGGEVDQALPFLALGFSVRGDLIGGGRVARRSGAIP